MFAYCENTPENSTDSNGAWSVRNSSIALTDGGYTAISKKDLDIIAAIESQGHHILRYNSKITSVTIKHKTFKHSANDCDIEATTTEKLLRWGTETTIGAGAAAAAGASFWPAVAIGVGVCCVSDLIFPPPKCPFDHNNSSVVYREDEITVHGYWNDSLTGTKNFYTEMFYVTYIEINKNLNGFDAIAVVRDQKTFEYSSRG